MLLETFAEHVASAIERIRQEKLLIQMQKDEIHQILEGASKVSNLVRHDLRGPLQTIRNASYLLMDKKATVEDMTPIINRSIEYMAKIIEDLRYMGNQGALEQLEIDLNNLIIQSIRQIFIPDNIPVEINFTEKKLVHQLDKIRIHRVLDNLIRNAVEAMPDGGKLTITTKKSTENISVIIEDTGHGIENMEDLFKPFHTTKEKGMGLGLISCKQAIEAHKGELKAFSEVGKGSRFEVIFPIQDKLDGEQCYQTQHHYADVEHEAQFS